MHVYVVKPGDTLTRVAHHYRVTPEALSLCNDLPNSPFLLPGQSLCIPSSIEMTGTDDYFTYQVQEGDTLRSLSARWKIPLTWLSMCNLRNDNTLEPGEILLVPHSNKRRTHAPPSLGLLSFDSLAKRGIRSTTHTYRAVAGLRVDAAGNLHVPSNPSPAEDEKTLLLCTLDGSANILPDVAKAILRSEHAQSRILDRLAAVLRDAGTSGVVFAWQGLRADCEVSYLQFVQKAGRRLRPMGLSIGLFLPADSALMKRTAQMSATVDRIDHVFYVPVSEATIDSTQRSGTPPIPLVGLKDTQHSLTSALSFLPAKKVWLVVHPAGLVTKQGRVLQQISPHAALRLAYEQGAPLVRDRDSELAWFRCREGGCSVWFEDLWSLVRKLELLNQMKLQGLALWEAGAYFPDAWNYVRDYLTTDTEHD